MNALENAIANGVYDELGWYEDQIRKYRTGELDETKMQKVRLHFGTYAQRQAGVQMQRIKLPGGFLTAHQLERLANSADQFGSSFIHFTTREDAQIYYVKLDEVPNLLRFLAEAGITTREACGNTVRNITACYRAGTSPSEPFDVGPYAQALFQYLVRNKYNQNLGRKFKITFEGCAEDHSALRIHDIGFWARVRDQDGVKRRGFQVYLGGGLGTTPHLAQLYTKFLPAEEIFNLGAAILRLFDRYGERKARMKARMKFLIQSIGWDAFIDALEEERERVGQVDFPVQESSFDGDVETGRRGDAETGRRGDGETRRRGDVGTGGRTDRSLEVVSSSKNLKTLDPRTDSPDFQSWARDCVMEHRAKGFRGVHVRLKLGDITSDRARQLAEVVREFSGGQLRISVGQNIHLPWVREERLVDLYLALRRIELGEVGAGTVSDVTTCPGSDTCRLGIASAKGLGSAISDAFSRSLADYREVARSLKIKISGCPNGCAQHTVANIGFHAAALSNGDRTVPAHLLSLGGQTSPDSAQLAQLVGKFPAKNCVKVVEALLGTYIKEKLPDEEFNSLVTRVGLARIKDLLEPLRHVPSFEEDPSLYTDFGHDNERFAVRAGIKGECAGSTVAEVVPQIEQARERLAQAEAFLYHREYRSALLCAYEAAALAARVPLYQRLVDPFTEEEALWEFENLFVLSGRTNGDWGNIASRFADLKNGEENEASARLITSETKRFVDYCDVFAKQLSEPKVLRNSSAA